MKFNLDEFVNNNSDVIIVDGDGPIEEFVREYIKKDSYPGTMVFYDYSSIVDQYKMWFKTFDHIQPFYAIKCNPRKEMCQLMLKLPGICFDCASPAEISTVLNAGIDPSRIIYANPVKSEQSILFMHEKKVWITTIDSPEEVVKMYEVLGEKAKDIRVVLRIYVDDSHSLLPLGSKFGCHPAEWEPVFKNLKECGMNAVGVSFHVGTGNYDSNAYGKAVEDAHNVFKLAEKYGFDMTFLDFGGGWPGTLGGKELENPALTGVAGAIETSLAKCGWTHEADTTTGRKRLQLISEPGRYFNACCIHVSLSVENVTKRGTTTVYTLNEGVMGVFKDSVLSELDFETIPLVDYTETFPSIVVGPSGQVFDIIIPDGSLPSMKIGDRILFKNLGAYTLSLTNLQLRDAQKSLLLVRKSSLVKA